MARNLYRVRDKLVNKFWNGDYRCVTFTDKGYAWNSKTEVQNAVSYIIEYQSRWDSVVPSTSTDNWEIVELELREHEVAAEGITDHIKFTQLKTEVARVSDRAVAFVEAMRDKKVLDTIEFVFVLKNVPNTTMMERTIEARAQMRQLGVKTRTFKERRGTFGMMDRQQALRARMVLDIEHAIDLAAIRQKVGI